MTTTLQVRRDSFAQTRLVESEPPPLEDGQIRVRVDKFALTSNNVTYALSGDPLGYWKFYPAEPPWGVVPVWGFADVVESRHDGVSVGERFLGFLPMASQAVLAPTHVTPRGFLEGSPHRQELAVAYNSYAFTRDDPPELAAIEDRRCILFPLYTLSFMLRDYLVDNAFFGARQVVVSSISSKTSLGFAKLVSDLGAGRPRIVGLTSPAHREFARGVGVCDQIATYDEIAGLDAKQPTVFVDMAGRGDVVAAVHRRFGENLKASIAIGVTHWETPRFSNRHGPTTPHTFFFAPAQIAKRDKEWGQGEVWRRIRAACLALTQDLGGAMRVSEEFGPAAAVAAWTRLVAGRQPPEIGVIASLSRSA